MGLSAPTMKIPPAAVITSPTAKVTTTAATNPIDLSAIQYDQNDDTRDNAVECRSFVHAGELVVGYDDGSR